jgi:hypothetical protein
VKLSKGEYTLKISRAGFKPSLQKIVVEAGKAQTFAIVFATIEKATAGGQ